MTDTQAARLCCQIVKVHFGPLTARVAHVLISRGRLTIPNVIQFSQLKPRSVRAALIVMIQHNLLRHFKSDDEGETVIFDTYECLMRLRFGQFVELTQSEFGEKAAALITTFLDHGKLRREEAIKFIVASGSSDTKSYHNAFDILIKGSMLCISAVRSHFSTVDRLLQIEAEERSAIKGIPAAKQLREIQEKAKLRLEQEDEEIRQMSLSSRTQSLKRKRDAVVQKDHHHYRVNYDRLNVLIRNKLIASAVREVFNESASTVMASILRLDESKSSLMKDLRSDPISVVSVATELDNLGDISKGLFFKTKQKFSASSIVREYVGWLSAADNPSASGRAGSFVSLLNSSNIQVEYEVILHRLRLKLLETVVRERHGVDAVRVLRVLLDHGKMDEKHLAKVAMVTNKEVRPLLATLSSEGVITLQDVPKGNDRNPNRTFYLWYVDLDKAYAALTRALMKTFFNTMSRHEDEAKDPLLRSVLEKRSRIDVAEDLSLLAPSEREVLEAWCRKSARYGIAEIRIERCLFVLRECHVTVETNSKTK